MFNVSLMSKVILRVERHDHGVQRIITEEMIIFPSVRENEKVEISSWKGKYTTRNLKT